MSTVHIPAQLRSLTGAEQLQVEATNVRQLIEALEAKFPGIAARLCDGDRIRPGLQVTIDGAVSNKGLAARLAAESEVYFLPAIGGG
ncbi:MoaD/ThiS family protein [Blastopirellula sp. JC732]|uniref:MoaD/ThiS family protein n=1 Tax=Blastopirellula sediminis TaxID=2894196 RepID=A0A9X1MJK0_9BACT|nr:MoaD/ThiS family protein [Blastopirellula sediminis]MCC9608970.1 MoaD/ThiS family protein [Blastopirellula sediminis]MCC9628253.1 MoaD/ThiS family protein [Blastopirellula sediminis]